MPRESEKKRKSAVASKNEDEESRGSGKKKSRLNGSTADGNGKRTYTKKIETTKLSQPEEEPTELTADPPSRNKQGKLVFSDWPDFQPSLTPKQVLQAGSFGGTYFRPIKSSITGKSYDSQVWQELPEDWLEGLKISKQVASPTYDVNVNTYRVKCGGSLQMWEESGWIHKQDPYGWFQWYCRFYQGRRTPDDERQIGRWLRCAGPKGRWKNNLISKCVKSNSKYDNSAVSPVVRQTLQHWAYVLSEADYNIHAKTLKKKGV